ncbi:MAG TPA: cytochrome P460 family protein [Rhizomicrobium sp.]|nr:cytochrome P460 family protein [Rhizomicrobium sp.]
MRTRIIALALAGAASLSVCAGIAIAQQDRYTLKLGKLAFSDFKGYENWQVVAVSRTDAQLKVIVANDVMMAAYRQGLPAKGKVFPEGSKIVKIEWGIKKSARSPYPVEVPDTLQAVATIEKDSKRFPDTHGWAYGAFNYNAASKTFAAQGSDAKCGYACHTKVASQDYTYTEYPFR